MKFLSKDEATLWCRQNEISLDDMELPNPVGGAAKFDIPPDAQHPVLLVAQSMAAFEGSREILVWFTDWEVWISGSRMHVF